jgi:hypothetical protein
MNVCQYRITRTSLVTMQCNSQYSSPVHDMMINVAVGVDVAPWIVKLNFGRKCSGLPGITGTHGIDDWLDSKECLRDVCSPAVYWNYAACPIATNVVIRSMLTYLLVWGYIKELIMWDLKLIYVCILQKRMSIRNGVCNLIIRHGMTLNAIRLAFPHIQYIYIFQIQFCPFLWAGFFHSVLKPLTLVLQSLKCLVVLLFAQASQAELTRCQVRTSCWLFRWCLKAEPFPW